MRTADGVGDHEAQRDARMPEQRRANGGVTVQVEIGLHRRSHLGPGGLDRLRGIAARDALRFLAGQIAFVEGHLAIAADIDIDAPAFALGRSEERRVGKEWVRQCRSRWSPYDEKNKTKYTIYTVTSNYIE